MSPAPVAFSRESFRHCPAARLPIAAAARCCPEFPPSTPTRPPRYSRKRPRKSPPARRSQECGCSAALPPWRLLRTLAPQYEEVPAASAFYGLDHDSHDAPRDEVPARRRVRCAYNFPEARRGESVDSVWARSLYRRFTVRGSPRVFLRAREAPSPIRASIRGPGVRFRSDRRNFDLSRPWESGATRSRAV